MRIFADWRDRFPKLGLNGNYIGDGYPLCADLPPRHYLKKGALYRLLGSSRTPISLSDPEDWENDPYLVNLSLTESSGLFEKLCARDSSGACNFKADVLLDEDLDCFEDECMLDTVRTLSINGIFYEYVQPPCVHLAFFDGGRSAVHQTYDTLVCADPRVADAVPTCCDIDEWNPFWNDKYYGERTLFSTAVDRCNPTQTLCDHNKRPWCNEGDPLVGFKCHSESFFWTTAPCKQKALINSEGRVAMVHWFEDANIDDTASFVSIHSKTFFRVQWTRNIDSLIADCGSVSSCSVPVQEDSLCLCDITIEESPVFGASTPSEQDILEMLHIGAWDGDNSAFTATDGFGRRVQRKNLSSFVFLEGTDIGFRNPPHFMSLLNNEPRDAAYETDATIDHYFYHPNTAPFLSFRLAQRFGISNPSPKLIEDVSGAFRSGLFVWENTRFGSNKYGDLGATIASLLLHDELRDIRLDSDPSFGALKEPLIKTLGMMRSLEFTTKPGYHFIEFGERFKHQIGQFAYEFPNVFSFFLPEFSPPGSLGNAGLVAPEAQVMTGPKVVDSLNGLISLIQWGLSDCFGGFGTRTECHWLDDFGADFIDEFESLSSGALEYIPSSSSLEAAVDEMTLLLTAGRISPTTTSVMLDAVGDQPSDNVYRSIQELISVSPEFHATGLVSRDGNLRQSEVKEAPDSSEPYRALVVMLLDGGVDSHNMVVPHSCSRRNENGQNLREQYEFIRTSIAMTDDERTRIVSAKGQPCSEFAIHQDLPVVERLYRDGDLSFFANVGVIDEPITKDDFYRTTELFAHNKMQEEAQRVDPWGTSPGTGVLGRLNDKLISGVSIDVCLCFDGSNGYFPQGFSSQSISIEEASIAAVGVPGGSVSPLIISESGMSRFNPTPPGYSFNVSDHVGYMTGTTELHSSLFAETWSSSFQRAFDDSSLLVDALNSITLSQEYDQETDNGDYLGKVGALAKVLLYVCTMCVSQNLYLKPYSVLCTERMKHAVSIATLFTFVSGFGITTNG